MSNPLAQLIEKHRKGNKATFNLYPFLSVCLMREKGLCFNNVLRNPEDMAKAALSNFELGFESTALPYDANVEAEVLGAEVRYYEREDGQPVYPTIPNKWVSEAEDIVIPANVAESGRMPVILECLRIVKEKASMRGAVGMWIPGPCTLAGQVMDLNDLFIMVLKQPHVVKEIFCCLAELIIRLRDVYVDAGADFIDIEDGGATSLSPVTFRELLLPFLKEIFAKRSVPHILSLAGRTNKFIDLMLECEPDGIGVDQENDIEKTREYVPNNIPLFAIGGDYFMLVNATPQEVEHTVKTFLDMGVTAVCPPIDIWPPAKLENIKAFVKAMRHYKG